MTLLPLFDNPLFLRNWRERLRPHYLGSAFIVAAFVIFLIVVGNYANRDSLREWDYLLRRSVTVSWIGSIFYQIAILEGMVILFFGTLSAYRNTAQEVHYGTIDFHRASPVRRIDQAVGLILGSAILEWIVFGVLAVIVAAGYLFYGFGLKTFVTFHFNIMLTALCLHTMAVWAGLFARPKKQGWGIFGVIASLYFVWMLIAAMSFMASETSAFYHATWLPAYERLHWDLTEVHAWRRFSDPDKSPIREAIFYGTKLPPLLLQLVVQFPLWLLALTGIKRRFASGENSALSKSQFMALYMLILFYYLGGIVTLLTQGGGYYHHYIDKMASHVMTVYMIYGFMFVGVLIATPYHLQYIQGLARAKKLGLARLSSSDDKSGNSLWTMVFCSVTAVFWWAYAFVFHIPSGRALLALAVILCQVLAFASLLEAFRLSRFHQKNIYLWTALGLLWVGIPLLGLALAGYKHSSAVDSSLVPFFAASPLFDGGLIAEMLDSRDLWRSAGQLKASLLLLVNFLLAFMGTFWAARERRRLHQGG